MNSHLSPDMQCPDIQVILAHFLRQIESRHACTPTQGPILLHWNSAIRSLEEFPWPLHSETGERVPPSEWEAFRRTHKFRTPSCLCPFIDENKYAESRIGLVEMATEVERSRAVLNGEYVAVCAEQRCGFLLCIERLYDCNGVKVKFYPKRAKALPPQQLAHISDIDKSFRTGNSLSQVMTRAVIAGMGGNLPAMTPREAKKPKEAFMRALSKGIPEAHFWAAFVQCLVCKDVVLRDTMAANHKCRHHEHSAGARYHPYSHKPSSTTVYATLGVAQGDMTERSNLRSLRGRSPVPTEVDDHTSDGEFTSVEAEDGD